MLQAARVARCLVRAGLCSRAGSSSVIVVVEAAVVAVISRGYAMPASSSAQMWVEMEQHFIVYTVHLLVHCSSTLQAQHHCLMMY
jgi:galactokinase